MYNGPVIFYFTKRSHEGPLFFNNLRVGSKFGYVINSLILVLKGILMEMPMHITSTVL